MKDSDAWKPWLFLLLFPLVLVANWMGENISPMIAALVVMVFVVWLTLVYGNRRKELREPAPRKYPRVGGLIDGTDDFVVEVGDLHFQTWSRENVMKEIAAGRAWWKV